MSENNTVKKSRGDLLHEQMVRLGELPPEKEPVNRKRIALTWLIIMVILAGLVAASYWRTNLIEGYEAQDLVAADYLADGAYGPYYRIGRLGLIIIGSVFTIVSLIRLIAPRRRKPNRSIGGDIGIYLMLLLVACAMGFPLLFSICSSLKPLDELFRFPPKVFPQHVTFDNFSDLFVTLGQSYVPFSRYLTNTVFITFVGTFGHLIIASMAAFVLAKYDFPGGKTFFSIVVTALMFSGYVTGIPNYVIMSRLHMIDTYWAVILPAVASPFYVFLLRQSMISIPDELFEAAQMDGAGPIRCYFSIALPVSKAILGAAAALSFADAWNMVEQPLVFLPSQTNLYPLSVAFNQLSQKSTGTEFAGAALYLLPALLIYFFFQEDIMTGIQLSEMK